MLRAMLSEGFRDFHELEHTSIKEKKVFVESTQMRDWS